MKALFLILLFPLAAFGTLLDIPHEFTDGTRAYADQVNDNFDEIVDWSVLIGDDNIVADAIKTSELADDAVTTANLINNVLATTVAGRAKMQDGFFDAGTADLKIADFAIPTDKMASGYVDSGVYTFASSPTWAVYPPNGDLAYVVSTGITIPAGTTTPVISLTLVDSFFGSSSDEHFSDAEAIVADVQAGSFKIMLICDNDTNNWFKQTWSGSTPAATTPATPDGFKVHWVIFDGD